MLTTLLTKKRRMPSARNAEKKISQSTLKSKEPIALHTEKKRESGLEIGMLTTESAPWLGINKREKHCALR